MKKVYQLLVFCEYENKQETHLLHVGSLHQCKAVQLLAKATEKKYIPKDAKITYKIEKVEAIQ